MTPETQIPVEAPECGEKQEKPQSTLSKIFNKIKWCVKWGMVTCGVLIIIYQTTIWSSVKYIAAAFGVFVLIIFHFWKWKRTVKLVKRVFITVFLVNTLFFSFIIILSFFSPWLGSDVVPGLTPEKILSLKLGMDKKEVLDIFGPPLYSDINYLYNNDISFPLKYATCVSDGSEFGFEFVVSLRDNKLYSTYIQLSDADVSDADVYTCTPTDCPGIIDKNALDKLCLISNHKVLNDIFISSYDAIN